MRDPTRDADRDGSSELADVPVAGPLRFPWKVASVAVAVLVTLVAAVWAWQPAPAATVPAPGESHQLGADQALCLHAGLVLRRSASYDLDLRLGIYASIDPAAIYPLEREANGFRAAAVAFPSAKTGLLRAVRAASLASLAIVNFGNPDDYLETISGRAAAIGNLRNACYQQARFDVGRMKVLP